MEKLPPISLYVHIPFCVKKCDYCDFLSAPADERVRQEYVSALVREITSYRETALARRPVRSIFLGGGTPSVLSVQQIGRILQAIRDYFYVNRDACEISMEMNPGTADREKCFELCKLGINRFSIGLQSPDDACLRRLGRIHTYRQFLDTYGWLREAGCSNINIDLMSALPGQHLGDYADGLHKVCELGPEHISAYSLILEEGTPLFDRYYSLHNATNGRGAGEDGFDSWSLPDEDEERGMYHETKRILAAYGYERYEISNYARAGYACYHNCVYWQRGEYLGLGLGAASLLSERRLKNTVDLPAYLGGRTIDEEQTLLLDEKDRMEETMYLGLRMMQGVDRNRFRETFHRTVEQVYGPVIEKYRSMGLLQTTDSHIMLTEKGVDVSNVIFADFLL
ncbi:MAG: radical SAM family heme chaperone HemW [Lachnospiraceae bacterium]|nr:radical SAM family heme chaperone HemW [Lachnospiraceae bacterium]